MRKKERERINALLPKNMKLTGEADKDNQI